jgi:hypothetical protein
MLYGSIEHVAARVAALPDGPAFATLVARYGDEATAAFIARDALHQALGFAMPPDALELSRYLPDAFPVGVN